MMNNNEADRNWQKAAKSMLGTEIKFLDPGEGVVSEQTLPGMSVSGKYYCYHNIAVSGVYKGLKYTYIKDLYLVHMRWQLKYPLFYSTDCFHQLLLHNATYKPQRIVCDAGNNDLRMAAAGEVWKKNENMNGYRIFSQKWVLTEEERNSINLITGWMDDVPGFWYPARFGTTIYFGYTDTAILCNRNTLRHHAYLPAEDAMVSLRNALDLLSLWDWNKEV